MTNKQIQNQEDLPSSSISDSPVDSRLSVNEAGFYREMRTRLQRFAGRFFKSRHDVEDVVQEAFVKAIEANNKSHVKHPKPYMYQTVKNLALNEIKKKSGNDVQSLGDFDLDIVLQTSHSLEEQFESRQRFELFCKAARSLPVKCRRVYVLRKVYGFSQKEIANKLGISIKTVEAHLTKAIIRSAEYMEDAESAKCDDVRNRRHNGA